MTRKEELLKKLHEKLAILEDEIIDYPPDANDDTYDQLVEEAKRTARAIQMAEETGDR